MYWLGRQKRMARSLALCKRIVEMKFQLALNDDEVKYLLFLADDLLPIHVHETIFIPYLKDHCSAVQLRQWLVPAQRYEIIGCYAQKELGHGSNVGGIETTATYIPESDEFEVHSPTLSSTKWWIGGLGVLATHAVVMARLIIGDKDFGVHPFLVQIRDYKNHAALSGIAVGDIGPKMGANSMDNGFVRFHRVRIPRTQMLMRQVQVDKNGKVTAQSSAVLPKDSSKMIYSSMLKMRLDFVGYSALGLARTATIAIRYTSVRRQFGNPVAENRIIEYPGVQYRVFPALAATFAFAFTSHAMSEQYRSLQITVNKSSAASTNTQLQLAELHANSSALKSYCTTFAAVMMEQCRLACGGHGYSKFSGFPDFYGTFSHLCTAEGENWLLTQQCVRWLLKQLAMASSANSQSVAPSAEYLVHYVEQQQKLGTLKLEENSGDLLRSDVILDVLGYRAYHKVYTISRLMADFTARNPKSDPAERWKSLHVLIYQASEAHAQYLIAKSFIQAIEGGNANYHQIIKPVQGTAAWYLREPIAKSQFKQYSYPLKLMFSFITMYWIDGNIGDYLIGGFMAPRQASLLKKTLLGYDESATLSTNNSESVMSSLTSHALKMTNLLSIPDYVINSALGNADGRVYERMWDSAVLNGLFSSPGASRNVNSAQINAPEDIINLITAGTSSSMNNLNRIYNRELYKSDLLSHLPGLNSLEARMKHSHYLSRKGQLKDSKPSGYYDGDQVVDKDRSELDDMREWQEVHSLVIKPLVSGTLANQFEKNKSKL